MRITKRRWDRLGGLRNPSLYRKERGGRWYYYQDTSHPAADYDYGKLEALDE